MKTKINYLRNIMIPGIGLLLLLGFLAHAQYLPPLRLQSDDFLAWDADTKEYKPKPGEMTAHYTFYVTNISTQDVVITNLVRSCGCTEATLPQQPWRMVSGTNGAIDAVIDLRGKSGLITKPLTVQSSVGTKTLWLKVNVPAPVATNAGFNMDRSANLQLALANRQAVFQNDCAKCHAAPTVGKMGKELYQAGCAICHEAEHRAPMVPDLRSLGHPTNAEHWRTWIASGKPGSMMPAFSQAEGGPLNDEQIKSLVDYLVKTIPSIVSVAPAN